MPKTSNILNTVAIEGFPFFLSISLIVAKPTPAISARSNCDIARVFLRLFNTSLNSISPINHTFDVKIYIISRNCKKKYNILDFFQKTIILNLNKFLSQYFEQPALAHFEKRTDNQQVTQEPESQVTRKNR